MLEDVQRLNLEHALRQKIFLVHFLAVQKLNTASAGEPTKREKPGQLKTLLETVGKSDYKRKILHFSKKIDEWHDEQNKLNSGTFTQDNEFIELESSPSHFNDLSDSSDHG